MDKNGEKLLISTKFAPPRISVRAIPRDRLMVEVQRLQACTVSLVIGSPGFGKTTLLAQWRQSLMASAADVAWLSLSADDKYLSTFYDYLMSALRLLNVISEVQPLGVPSAESIDQVVATVVNGACQSKRELYLIIDDYQFVVDPRAHKLMQKLLDHAPANLHFVIASRVQPPLTLIRLRMLDQVFELDSASLTFDLAETRAFVDLHLSSLKLTVEEIHLIYELSNGWPASLHLFASLLRSDPSSRHNLREVGWRSDDLHTYLAEDVLAHLPPEVGNFMECVSVCRRFNASLACAVTGDEKAADTLRRLEEENLLIYRVDSGDRQLWYRFHPLFGEFLATHLARRDSRDVAQLHQRAAQWLATRGLLAEAVHHATHGGDLEFAANLIERAAPNAWRLDQLGPLLRLLDRLPQNLLLARPRLFFVGALVYALTSRPDKADAWLDQFMKSGAAERADIESRVPFIQAAIAVQRDRTEQVIGLLKGFQPLDNDYLVMRYGPSSLLAMAYAAAGRYAEAHACLDRYPTPNPSVAPEMSLVMEGARTLCLLLEGRVADAERSGANVLQYADAVHGQRSSSSYFWAVLMTEVHYERDRVDEAREIIANRVGLMQSSMPDSMVRITLSHARLELLQESPARALDFLERQERYFRGIGQDRALAHSLAEQVRIRVREKAYARAAEQVEQLEALATGYAPASGLQAREIPAQAAFARARHLLATSYPERALERLEIVKAFARDYVRGQLMVTVQLLMAIAQDDLRQHEQVDRLLQEALESASKLGLVRTLVDEGERLRCLLLKYLRQIPEGEARAEYLVQILGHFPGGEGVRSRETYDITQPLLTPRECDILQLISQAMTNKRVALTLNISLETVKWNLKNTFVKLGVSSRYDAVASARKQGLID